MKTIKRLSILGLFYVMLFALGFSLLENLESKKVYPFEHVQVGFYSSVKMGFIIFLIIYLPITIVTDLLSTDKKYKIFWGILKTPFFSILGVVIGQLIFYMTYPEWVELSGYILNKETALIIFGLVGFIYSLITIIYKKKF
ncbi:hypothetical protein DS745_03045 [Anaerobacillus alkaliphilus]|uniref:Permease n=1 Tax=Anaerobacillus alkaliphilus TaxID=1548597 RepID=A0A4Q0VYZ5_9BACI|nr:hypothetical protein [Anaerobacillus alkaliphilus]RXJ04376.1 hypothetical protein DS745_03045 [Anaerobacillus alkaliphilus]